jgi:GT2 family glycosyltransferase
MSVVVPTYNRVRRLSNVLEALAGQKLDAGFEIVVVSDGSTDDTDRYLHGGEVPPQVRAFSQSNQGPSAARNLGVQHARGELIAFVDDDVVAEPGLLQAHLDAHRRLGDRTVVIGPMLSPNDHQMSPWVEWEQNMLSKQYAAMTEGRYTATARQLYTGNASIRAEHFRRAGGFDPSFRRAEDVELAFRLSDLGLDFHFEPSAVGLHYAERPYAAWRRTANEYGHNDIVFARDLGREWLYGFISRTFREQHRALQRLIIGCAHSARRRAVAIRALELLVRPSQPFARMRWRQLTRSALSGIYAVEYYGGVADELGARTNFDELIRDVRAPTVSTQQHGMPDRR